MIHEITTRSLKMGQATSNQVCNNSGGGDEDVAAIDSRLLECRQNFMKAVQKGEKYTHFVLNLISLPCPVSLKYALLNVKHILEQNNQSEEELKKIPIALVILEKYCRHLLKPVAFRAEMWRSVKYSNPIYEDRVEPLKGSTDIMELMGYTVKVEDGVYFPEGKEPDVDIIYNLLTDIIMARQEMELYLIGAHPQPAHIDQYLPQSTIMRIRILQQSGYKTSSTSPEKIDSKTGGEMKNKGCTICLDKKAVIFCEGCDKILMCEMCDSKWHEHPRRQQPNHKRKKIEAWNVIPQSSVKITHQGAYGLGLLSVSYI
ncbi:E3 ubiquitin-protein ligase RNF31 isoform X3 [Patella vulgata]|uniref:E3 ubiquitin-protein ligase RNF31 isoform X3 n=1 Tax=Patella vulgata TaxID=6465 RepID=UPI00217F998B|nr:E3 ubiquitin-protein ligase RNF31 isoform X3 [Patella vulgata]